MSSPTYRPRLVTAFLWITLWLLSRFIIFLLWSSDENYITSDVIYYYYQFTEHGWRSSLVEYPTPIAAFIAILAMMSSSVDSFIALFICFMCCLDGLTSLAMWRSGYRKAGVYWAVFMFFVGPLMWTRVDLLSAIPVAYSLIWLTSRPHWSGSMIAVGASTKLWPAILIAPLIGRDSMGRKRLFSFLCTGGILGLASIAFFGWHRSYSPLTWQGDRGLQIESVFASVPMLLRALYLDGGYHVDFSAYNAWEIFGPSVKGWQHTASLTMSATFVIAALLAWMIAFRPRWKDCPVNVHICDERSFAIALAITTIIAWVIVSNKTFSPQYIIWLAGPLAVLASLARSPWQRSLATLCCICGLILAIATHLIFPIYYGPLITPGDLTMTVTLLLIGRNVLMVLFAIGTLLAAIQHARMINRMAKISSDDTSAIL